MYSVLRSTTNTLINLLEQRLSNHPQLGALFGGVLTVSAATPEETRNDGQGVSIWLYRIERDEQTLNYPPRRLPNDSVEHRPLPLRLHYLVTPVFSNIGLGANVSTTEQEVLGVVLQTFNDLPILKGSLLQDDLAGSDLQLAVRLESLDLEAITRIWDALEGSYQLSVSYEVSLVFIDSARPAQSIAPVHSVHTDHGLVLGRDTAEAP
jgi:hypothetical protein